MSVYQMNAQQLYETYTPDIAPEDLLNQGRDAIAQRLIHKNQITMDKAAYYVADQVLLYAEHVEDGIPLEPGPNLDSGEYR